MRELWPKLAVSLMITGGTLRILGMDPATDGPAIRARLGVCPQKDILDECGQTHPFEPGQPRRPPALRFDRGGSGGPRATRS